MFTHCIFWCVLPMWVSEVKGKLHLMWLKINNVQNHLLIKLIFQCFSYQQIVYCYLFITTICTETCTMWLLLAPLMTTQILNTDVFIRLFLVPFHVCTHKWLGTLITSLLEPRYHGAHRVLLVMFKHKESPSSPSPSLFSLCWFTTVCNQPALEACLHGDKGGKKSDDVAGRTAVSNQPCVSVCACVDVWVYRRQAERERDYILQKKKKKG